MSKIWTVFKKEILDTIRDRRTLSMILLVPLLLLPLLSFLYLKVMSGQSSNAMEKDLVVAITDNGNGADLLKRFNRRRDLKVIKTINLEDYRELIRSDSLDLAMIIDPEFDEDIANGKTAQLKILYNSTKDSLIYERFVNTIRGYKEEELGNRLADLQIQPTYIQPIALESKDVYNPTESLGKLIGGILPYFFVIFTLMGAMYPAIDMFTGEKERGTIETILSVPIPRIYILLGKMLVVMLTGILSGLLTIASIFLALKINTDIPQVFVNIIYHLIAPQSLIIIIAMLLPLSAFFAGLLIPICIYSRSFKEAQSIIQPLTFILIVPLMMGASSAIQLNNLTAFIPLLNIALVTKELVAGTLDYQYLVLVFFSLFLFAGISIWFSVRNFEKESAIFRM